MTRLRYTVTGTYETEDADYEGSTPEEIAAEDQKMFDDGGIPLGEITEWGNDAVIIIEVA